LISDKGAVSCQLEREYLENRFAEMNKRFNCYSADFYQTKKEIIGLHRCEG
jgi:hypothetical protein